MTNNKSPFSIKPRLIRLRDVPLYVGMDRNRFNKEVRPFVTEVRIGKQGIAFDTLELDSWVDQYKSRNGRPANNTRGEQTWDANKQQVSGIATEFGISRNRFSAKKFTKALEQAVSKKRSLF